MFYKNKSSVISSKERQQGMMHDIHVGITNDSKAKINVSYQGMDMQLKKNLGKTFRREIESDIERFMKKCDRYQKQGKIMKISTEFHSIPVKTEVI